MLMDKNSCFLPVMIVNRHILAYVMLNSDLTSNCNVKRYSNSGVFEAGIMRFRTGTKVEVLSKSSVPSGAWRSAEIISGNGHYYAVMFDNDGTMRVPRKSMRPKPPPSQVLDSWVPGDIVEVFEDCSWKIATISKVLGKDCFLIRLLGSSLKLKVTKFDIRVRQTWRDNEWIMIGQGASRLSGQTSTEKLTRKRNPKGDSKDKLDESDAYPLKLHEEEDRHSIASSVGSCTMDTYGLNTVSFRHIETDNTSDTESSSCGYRKKKFSVSTQGLEAADVHKLELDEYRWSIERLHASGPIITWEQETWITNLRLRLNISNEEHLMQLRNLISDDNSTAYR